MSALGGIFQLDNAPVDGETMTALWQSLASRCSDGGAKAQAGSVGMCYQAFHTNHESHLERQPLISESGEMLAYDGRLDCRSDFIVQLRDQLRQEHTEITDIDLVMAAYQKWGVSFLSRLIGDFALSLWDPRTQTLLLARDPFGPRPLFYYCDNNKVIWSSDSQSLVKLSNISLEIDDDYIAMYLTQEPDPRLTPYKHIHAVCPGSVIIVRNGYVQTKKIWSPSEIKEIRYRDDSEYEEHFSLLFRDSVRCRMRVEGQVWAELSGGVDSSSIVCVANEVMNNNEAQASNLKTVSYIYDLSSSSNELQFIKRVEEKIGTTGLYLKESIYKMLPSTLDGSFVSTPGLLYFYAEGHRRMCEEMQRNGARVLMTGQGGDHLLWSSAYASPEVADHLARFKLSRLHTLIKAYSCAENKPYLTILCNGGILPLLQGLGETDNLSFKKPRWLCSSITKNIHQRRFQVELFDKPSHCLPSRRKQLAALSSIVSFISAGYYRDWGPIDVVFPYLHKPLVEFLLAIPFEQILRPGETRSLQRRALRGILPRQVVGRKSKSSPDEAHFRAIAREWPRLMTIFADARICTRSYVDSKAFGEALNRARYGNERYSHTLCKAIALEFWLRGLERWDLINPQTSDLGERHDGKKLLSGKAKCQ